MGIGRGIRTILAKANLKKAYAMNANFSYANLDESNLTETICRGADFSRATLRAAILVKTDFTYAELINADLSDSIIIEINLTEANLDGTKFKLTGEETIVINNDGSTEILKGKEMIGYLINKGALIVGVNEPVEFVREAEDNFR